MPAPNKEIDKGQIKMLYMTLGPSETARQTGIKRGTVTKWASRYKWTQDKLLASVPAVRPGRPALSVSQLSHEPNGAEAEAVPDAGEVGAAALKRAHAELGDRTRTALARTVAAAAEAAAQQPAPPVLSTGHLRELAASAARVFGWDAEKGAKAGDTYNTLVISADQLKQIGMLRGA